MRRPTLLALAAPVVAVTLAGCGGSSSPAVGGAPAGTTPKPSAPGGIAGVIDAAKLTAACANAADAQTALSGGMGATTVDPMLTAAAAVLAGPPPDPRTTSLSATLRADVQAGHDAEAVAALTAFCHANGR